MLQFRTLFVIPSTLHLSVNPNLVWRHGCISSCTCRLAQTTYKTPSTVQDETSPSQASFCFPSPITDNSSPLATFLHQLSHATYDSQDSPAESAHGAQPGAQAQCQSPDACQGPTPFQDFVKYLTQATYHSPGSKADGKAAGVTGQAQSISADDESATGPSKNIAVAEACHPPGVLALLQSCAYNACMLPQPSSYQKYRTNPHMLTKGRI